MFKKYLQLVKYCKYIKGTISVNMIRADLAIQGMESFVIVLRWNTVTEISWFIYAVRTGTPIPPCPDRDGTVPLTLIGVTKTHQTPTSGCVVILMDSVSKPGRITFEYPNIRW